MTTAQPRDAIGRFSYKLPADLPATDWQGQNRLSTRAEHLSRLLNELEDAGKTDSAAYPVLEAALLAEPSYRWCFRNPTQVKLDAHAEMELPGTPVMDDDTGQPYVIRDVDAHHTENTVLVTDTRGVTHEYGPWTVLDSPPSRFWRNGQLFDDDGTLLHTGHGAPLAHNRAGDALLWSFGDPAEYGRALHGQYTRDDDGSWVRILGVHRDEMQPGWRLQLDVRYGGRPETVDYRDGTALPLLPYELFPGHFGEEQDWLDAIAEWNAGDDVDLDHTGQPLLGRPGGPGITRREQDQLLEQMRTFDPTQGPLGWRGMQIDARELADELEFVGLHDQAREFRALTARKVAEEIAERALYGLDDDVQPASKTPTAITNNDLWR